MGKAKRRRRAIERGADPSLHELHQEAGGGLFRLELIGPDDALAMAAAALAGDARASQFLSLIEQFWRLADERRQAADPLLCALCDDALRAARTALLAIVRAERADARHALTLGLCVRCCAAPGDDPAAIEAALIRSLRRAGWVDLRRIGPPFAEPGHA